MNTRVSPPHPQPGPVALAVVCIFGIALAVRGLLTVRIGNGPWSVGAMALFILIVAFAFIEVGWLWIQREVDISDGAILVRRWIEILRGRPVMQDRSGTEPSRPSRPRT
jgi:hypothetical protein